MSFTFYKYEATGNDFIVIDNRESVVSHIPPKQWQTLCERRKGIGADGVLLLEKSEKADFKMRIINADGGEVSMCGNGVRAIVKMAHDDLKLKNSFPYSIETAQGVYHAEEREGLIAVQMTEYYDVGKVNLDQFSDYPHKLYLNTGVPHAVFQVEDLQHFPVQQKAQFIQGHKDLFPEGVNVNFFEILSDNYIFLRTFERGVGETLSCGTGVTATALACADFFQWEKEIKIKTLGGKLLLNSLSNRSIIFLSGPVCKNYQGFL